MTIPNTTEEEIIRGYKPNMLYFHEFDKGRFFQVVHDDEQGFQIKLAPRTMLKVIYLKDEDDIGGLEIIKLISETETQKIRLNNFNLAQLKAFLSFISQIDLKGVSERRIKLYDEHSLDASTIKTVKTLLAQQGGDEIVEALIDDGVITSKDIVNTHFRKRGLEIFHNLLQENDYWKNYAAENQIGDAKEEKVWQYFFEKNEWIFGYGLDYRFQAILQREAHISDIELDGSNFVIADYLLGDKMFTTFVEIKKPSTPLFGKIKNRSNSWSLSEDLINSVSQILEQKASGLIKFERQQYDTCGAAIAQKACDSKVVLIIGSWRELESASNPLEKEIKKKTFELFRRDSRNVEIITYDELYDRAKFIVSGKGS
ncbi:MAG: DUF4263 domain-containing protein [Sphingobacteriales bacterium]|nr:MAG: DUF4263 domain-containing protein [Sphingobacteriales bacterium]